MTGSIARPLSPLSHKHDREDWRRARSAMGTALDPQGNGTPVTWSNPRSGNKGMFTPVAAAYPIEGRVCRAFTAKLEAGDTHEEKQGIACRDRYGDWDINSLKSDKKL